MTLWHLLRSMNAKFESLFADLKSSSQETQNESALILGCLLERALWPGRYDAQHQSFLPKEAVELRLESDSEIEAFIQDLAEALESPDVSINTKISLSTFLAKTGRVNCVTAILQLLKSEVDTLDDRQAYALIAPVLPGSQPSLLEKFEPTLNQLLTRKSEHLNQPVAMSLRSIYRWRQKLYPDEPRHRQDEMNLPPPKPTPSFDEMDKGTQDLARRMRKTGEI